MIPRSAFQIQIHPALALHLACRPILDEAPRWHFFRSAWPTLAKDRHDSPIAGSVPQRLLEQTMQTQRWQHLIRPQHA